MTVRRPLFSSNTGTNDRAGIPYEHIMHSIWLAPEHGPHKRF
jgi:hypothetical protein